MTGLAAHPQVGIVGGPLPVNGVAGKALGPDPGPMGGAGHVDVAGDAGHHPVTTAGKGFRGDLQGNGGFAPLPLYPLPAVAFETQGLRGKRPFVALDVRPAVAIEANPFLPVNREGHGNRFRRKGEIDTWAAGQQGRQN